MSSSPAQEADTDGCDTGDEHQDAEQPVEARLPTVPVGYGEPKLLAGAADLKRGQRARVEVCSNTNYHRDCADPSCTTTLQGCPHVSLRASPGAAYSESARYHGLEVIAGASLAPVLPRPGSWSAVDALRPPCSLAGPFPPR